MQERKAKMKICLLARYFDMRNAGLGRVAMELRDRLIERGHDVSTVSTNGSGPFSYFRYTAFEMPFRKPKGCDIYHAITPMEAIWIPGKKMVVTFHDLILCTDPEKAGAGLGGHGWKNWIGRNYFATAVSLAQAKARSARIQMGTPRIVCVSEQTKSDLMRCFGVPKDDIAVIKSGISPALEPMLKPDVFRIGYLGQLDRRKRVGLLIDAFKQSDLDADLVIAGIGVDMRKLMALADGNPSIKFTGLVPEKHLHLWYNSIDIFVLPTMIEGYGLPAVEAMACKKPVVVLGDAIIPDEIKSRCVVVDDLVAFLGDEEAMWDAIGRVDYEDNYAFAKSHDWEKTADDYEALYREVAC